MIIKDIKLVREKILKKGRRHHHRDKHCTMPTLRQSSSVGGMRVHIPLHCMHPLPQHLRGRNGTEDTMIYNFFIF